LRRTYPNWISREGARGMEYNAWGTPINSVDHEVNLIFTRMLSGPMDYTPGILSLEGVKGRPINSTQAKPAGQLRGDLLTDRDGGGSDRKLRKYPARSNSSDVPTDWSDTRVLHGELGEYATIARKDRRSEDWHVGSVTDGNARVVAATDLPRSGRHAAEIYRDGEHADYRTIRRFDIVIEKRPSPPRPSCNSNGTGRRPAIRLTPLKG
jgi:alpha-glucosidase